MTGFHISRNPTRHSTLGDVLVSYSDQKDLNNYIAGTGHARYAEEEHEVHSTREKALRDIVGRCASMIDQLAKIREEAEAELDDEITDDLITAIERLITYIDCGEENNKPSWQEAIDFARAATAKR